MYYRCLRSCLCQKHETDSLGRYVELVNLRAKEGKVYDEAYDLTLFNLDDEAPFFEETRPGLFTRDELVVPGSDIKPPDRKLSTEGTAPAKKKPVKQGG